MPGSTGLLGSRITGIVVSLKAATASMVQNLINWVCDDAKDGARYEVQEKVLVLPTSSWVDIEMYRVNLRLRIS